MMLGALRRLDRVVQVVAGVTALVVIAVLVFALWPRTETRQLTAYFPKAIGLYEGSDVRVLGIPIGTVDQVVPSGRQVRVEMSYDAQYQVPANAKAAVISPSIVSDRYVQLTPAYTEGPVLADGAELPLDRNAVPVELDRIYASLDDLATALGPEGVNADGTLSELLRNGADNLDGQGEKLHRTIEDLADAVDTFSDGRGDLFDTVDQLEELTRALAENDTQVRRFNAELEDVAAQLSGERDDLRLALRELAIALTDVSEFVRENRGELRDNVDGLTELSETLVRQQDALREFLDNAPVALANLDHAYNPTSGTLDTRVNLAQTDNPELFVCSLLEQLKTPNEVCAGLTEVLDRLPRLPQVPGGPASRVPGQMDSTGPATGGTPSRDLTLGGVLPEEGDR